MNFFLAILFLKAFLFNTSESMKQNDYCKMTQMNCNGYYDFRNKYVEKCVKLKCNDKYKHECLGEFCSIDQKSCDELVNTHRLIRSITNSHIQHREIKRLKNFKNHFKSCPLAKFDLKTSDFCLNGLNCFQVKSYTYRNFRNNIEKLMICPCRGKRTYHCGNFFCTANSQACDALKKQISSLKNSNNLTKCGNDSIVIQRHIKLF